MFRAVADGRIKALWIMATNPVVSMPEADRVEAAIRACPFVVVSDVTAATDTARLRACAPARRGWGEKDGTVTNSERRISRQRTFLPAPGEARPDWWIICEVAKPHGLWRRLRLCRSPAEIFAEHAALSAFENDGARDFDIGALAALDDAEYDDLEPVQWPRAAEPPRAGAHVRRRRLLHAGPQGALRRVSTQAGGSARAGLPADAQHRPRARPLAHHDAHGQERSACRSTAPSPSSRSIRTTPSAITSAMPTSSASRPASAPSSCARCVTPRQQPGSIFVPMHWNDQFASRARVDVLAAGDHRSDLRPAGLEEYPGARRALRRRDVRLRRAAP